MLDRLTLDQLRTLVAVADTGSFSAAGRSLGRVQSAVSQTVQALEATLDVTLFDRSEKTPVMTDAGRALLPDARRLIAGAEALRARAESISSDIEPELALAVEAMFPNGALMESLKVVRAQFPNVPVTVFTEALGGAEQRLREGSARIGLYPPRPTSEEFVTQFLVSVTMIPVVAASHPLAQMPAPISRATLEDQVQLVLTDRTSITANFSGGVISRKIWRFADLATRLEYLLEGFGWCNMPYHMVRAHVDAGRLKHLELAENRVWQFPIHIVHHRNRPLQRAGKLLMDDLRQRLKSCPAEFTEGAAPPQITETKRSRRVRR